MDVCLSQKESVPQIVGHGAAGEFYHSGPRRFAAREFFCVVTPGDGHGSRSGECEMIYKDMWPMAGSCVVLWCPFVDSNEKH